MKPNINFIKFPDPGVTNDAVFQLSPQRGGRFRVLAVLAAGADTAIATDSFWQVILTRTGNSGEDIIINTERYTASNTFGLAAYIGASRVSETYIIAAPSIHATLPDLWFDVPITVRITGATMPTTTITKVVAIVEFAE